MSRSLDYIPTTRVNAKARPIKNALIIFIDIINSSTYSKYHDLLEYASWVNIFVEVFTEASTIFFKSFDKNDFICHEECRGDEGFLCIQFLNPPDIESQRRMTNRALAFLHIFIAELHLRSVEQGKFPINIAVGMNYGQVVQMGENRLCGHDINFAKRIETESRDSFHTGIFVSQGIKDLLKSDDIIFKFYHRDVKGISRNTLLYEIQYSFIDIFAICEDVKILDDVVNLIAKKRKIEFNFHTSILMSIYYFLCKVKVHLGVDFAEGYDFDKIMREGIVWNNVYECDPTILLLRGKHYEEVEKHLNAIYYYKKAIEACPEYVRPVILFASLLCKMKDVCRTDFADAKAMANDLIDNFSHVINKENKQRLENALKEVQDEKG